MPINTHTRLSISVFAKKNKYRLYFKAFIRPLFRKLEEAGYLMDFQIMLNNVSGDNIRLVLVIANNMQTEVIAILQTNFADFINCHALHPKACKNEQQSIFMNFPVNSIQYGLFSTRGFVDDPTAAMLRKGVSKMMIGLFCQENVDDDLLVTFAVCIWFSWIRVLLNSNSISADQITETLTPLNIDVSEEGYLLDSYNILIPYLAEFYRIIIGSRNYKHEFNWLEGWEITLHSVINQGCCLKDFMCISSRLNSLIKVQLSLSGYADSLVNFLVKHFLGNQVSDSIL